jgi:plastocyanin
MQVRVSLCSQCGQVVWEPRPVVVDPGETVQWINVEGQELSIDFQQHPFDPPKPPFKAPARGSTPVAHVKTGATRGDHFPCKVTLGGVTQEVEGVIIR